MRRNLTALLLAAALCLTPAARAAALPDTAAELPAAFALRAQDEAIPAREQAGTAAQTWAYAACAAAESGIRAAGWLDAAAPSAQHLLRFAFQPLSYGDDHAQAGEGKSGDAEVSLGGREDAAALWFSAGSPAASASPADPPEKQALPVRFPSAAGPLIRDANFLPELAQRDGESWLGLNPAGTEAVKRELLAGRAVMVTCDEAAVEGLRGTDAPSGADASSGAEAKPSVVSAEGASGTAARQTADTPVSTAADTRRALCIVGWDDDYAQARANRDAAAGNGAWLVLDPWDGAPAPAGSASVPEASAVSEASNGAAPSDGRQRAKSAAGYESCFYLSYYEPSLARPASFAFFPDSGDTEPGRVYQYDYLAPDRYYAPLLDETVREANLFTMESDCTVRAAAVFTGRANTHVELRFYLLNDDAATPEDGTLLCTREAEFPWAGYHRTELPEPFSVRAGERVSVVATLRVARADGSPACTLSAAYCLPEDARGPVQRRAVLNRGESALYRYGRWSDWLDAGRTMYPTGAENAEYDNFPLKLFAVPAGPEEFPPDFSDVEQEDWLYEAAVWATSNGIAPAFEDGSFGTEMLCSVGESILMLWRASGAPRTTGRGSTELEWAVSWLEDSSGVLFRGENMGSAITRLGFVRMLYLVYGDLRRVQTRNSFEDLTDALRARYSYADAAVDWAVEKGVAEGVDAAHFCPEQSCTLGELVAMLYRCARLFPPETEPLS